jgi:Protein of Unknown function (DUF2784)
MFSWPQIALALAVLVLALHLAFILWVMVGAVFTRGRPWLAWTHILCAVYGVVIEAGPWPCPLTLAENWFEVQAGRLPYHGPFLLHYLDAIVYPNVPPALLTWLAVVVLAINAVVYARRLRRSRALRSS